MSAFPIDRADANSRAEIAAKQLDTVIGSGGSGCCRDRLFFQAGVRARAAGGAEVTRYAGVDVSLETSSICIVDGAGTIVRELKAEPDYPSHASATTTR